MINYKLIGQRIRSARIKNKITQEKLAKQLKVSTEYCSKIERGRVQINLRRLSQIACILNEKIEFLIAGTVIENQETPKENLNSILESLSDDKLDAAIKIINIIANID